MDLTPEQKEVVAEWVSEGASIADVQKRLNEEFQLGLTYMEARFLIDDLELELKDKEKKPEASDVINGSGAATGAPSPQPAGDEAYDLEPEATGAVTVDVDRIARPGMVVSGNVVFSDGAKSGWGLDQQGRLALEPETSGYQPVAADIETFQQELSRQLQKQGF